MDAPSCNGFDKNRKIILQADHLTTRANSATFADTRLIVCVCKGHHGWKKWHQQEYEEVVLGLALSEAKTAEAIIATVNAAEAIENSRPALMQQIVKETRARPTIHLRHEQVRLSDHCKFVCFGSCWGSLSSSTRPHAKTRSGPLRIDLPLGMP